MFIKVSIIDLKYEWKTCFFSYVNKSKTLSISHMTSSVMIIFRILAYKPFLPPNTDKTLCKIHVLYHVNNSSTHKNQWRKISMK